MAIQVMRPRWVLIAPLIAFALMSVVAKAEGPRGAEWASKDAVIYLEASHPEALLDRVLDPKFQSYLVTIPPYARYFKSDAYRQQKAGMTMVATLLGTTWEKGVRSIAGGGIVLAIEAEKGKAPWGFVVVTPSDPAFLSNSHIRLLELARNDAKDKGQPDPVKESEHQGIKIFSTGKDLSHAILKETLVISPSIDAIKTVIDRATVGKLNPITASAEWKSRHDRVSPSTMAWGLVRLDRLREIDPKKFTLPETTNPVQMFLFGDWIEAARKAPWVAAEINWSDAHLVADVNLPTPAGGYSEVYKKFLPPKGTATLSALKPQGVIANLSYWRDLSSLWDVRSDLFPPQVVQSLAQLDTFAGQFFGGRDFGSGVLGSLGNHWRIVVAEQDYTKINPVPDLKLPAVAIVVDLKPDDEEFAQRLKLAFQSFIGLANLGAAQAKAPPLELLSETVDGVALSTTHFVLPKTAANPKEPVHQRQNYSPTVAQVGNFFVLSSSLGLTKDLILALKETPKSGDTTLLLEADGPSIAKILGVNRQRLVTQNMMEKGNDKAAANSEIDLLLGLLRYAGRGTLSAKDGDTAVNFRLDFALGAK